jgi:uncharacterized protein YuzE
MHIEYFPDTDTLYIRFHDGPGADASEVAPGVVIDFDTDGDVVGIEIERAVGRSTHPGIQVTGIPST